MEAKHKEISCGSIMPPKHPWFVSQKVEDEGDNTQFHIFYNIHDPMSHYRCQIPELLGKRIRGCFHGCWAVLSSNHPRDVIWSLWNPITSKIINLPTLDHSVSEGDCGEISECCLSAPPEDSSSVLLLMRTAKPNFVYCRLGIDSSSPDACNGQELRWTESTYANQITILTESDGLLRCLTCCNGKVYAYIHLSTRLIVEVNIDCEIKKEREVVITLLPILEFVCPIIIDCPLILPLLKGSSTELFLVVLGLKDKGKTVGAVNLLKLDMNNMAWEEIEDLKDTILSVELDTDSPILYSPAIASSEFGGYIHILADKGKIIYSYHVKDKTISFSSIPCVAGTNHVSAWTMPECTRLGVGRVHVHCKQKKKGHKEDETVVRSVKGNHVAESHLLNFRNGVLKIKESCVGVECRLESDKVDDDESHLLNLPPHVLEMLIMEFGAGVDYLKFRATCKRCHLAAPLIPWNNGKASKIMQKYSVPSPWLIVFDKHKGIITLTDPAFGDKYFIRTPQELICDFQIKCSRFGWLLIFKPGGSLMFFNPFTSDIIELPELPELPDTDIICFSAPPTSPNCMVVGITLQIIQCYACIHTVGGEPSWRRFVLGIWDDKFFNSGTLYGRDLYALREDGGDVFREMGTEAPSRERLAKAPTSCCKSLPQCFLLKCDQHLLRVIVGKFGESVEVFESTSSKKWVKIDTLGKHAMFICGASSVCLDAKTPQLANKIYFPSSPIMYYSLETCRFHTLNNEDSFGDFFGTKHHLSPHGWIEPRWS
ncbi:hypothetical protein CTI12_AA181340 [Artemisia annua]|uniref:KIB1-4 beta-propeller domain-containing protein n=1 Tax=Artemisia annua TaxID=35608 RepID=A0A2U1P8N9_ARTAN|nr:hypothetical protein CTI12_AA181340 [Artemisia annua]